MEIAQRNRSRQLPNYSLNCAEYKFYNVGSCKNANEQSRTLLKATKIIKDI